MCLAGAFVAIELKTDEGVLDPLQKYNLDCIATANGIAIVMTPGNTEETLLFLESMSNEMSKYAKQVSTTLQ